MGHGRVGEQSSSYRRGMVLGLTMAEIALLIIFVLMLFLARQIRREGNRVPTTMLPTTEFERYRAQDSILRAAVRNSSLSDSVPPDDFARLVQAVAAVGGTQDGRVVLEEAASALADIRRTNAEMNGVLARFDSGGADTAAAIAERKEFRLANQEGQIRRLQDQLRAAGGGAGERPCWARNNGQPEYLYDIVLLDNGLRVRDHDAPDRVRERAQLRPAHFGPDEVVTPADFLSRTKAIYDYGRELDCRFYVVVYDGTGRAAKLQFQEMLRTVEGHFYKRIDYSVVPF